MTNALSRKEIASWLDQWRSVFARNVPNVLGKSLPAEGEFGVFDHQFMRRFLHGGKAEYAYDDAVAVAVVTIWEVGRNQRGEIQQVADRKPSTNDLKRLAADGQALIFDVDLEWTALFHHDDYMPTCFARREWVGDR